MRVNIFSSTSTSMAVSICVSVSVSVSVSVCSSAERACCKWFLVK